MEKYDVELLPVADEDLDEIFDYILSDNPQAAVKMLDNIIEEVPAAAVWQPDPFSFLLHLFYHFFPW